MLTLALETSTRRGSVALGQIGGSALEVLGEETLEVSATHSETVLPAVDRLLRAAGRGPGELEAVAVGAGPGSFTGVRIAAALARGLCFPGRAALFAYSSLAAIAVGAGASGDVCALLDARRGQVYAAGYAVDPGSFEERFAPRAAALADILAEIEPARWTFAAALPGSLRDRIAAAGGELLPAERGRPTARALLSLAHAAPESGRVARPAHWEPQYVRASSAERRVGDA